MFDSASEVSWVDPIPGLPGVFPSPFDPAPHPAARDVGERLKAWLARGEVAPGIGLDVFERPEGGKMLGVLLVREPGSGRLGVLRAFSGQLAGRWDVPGWAPPLFPDPGRARLQERAEAAVTGLTHRLERLASEPEVMAARAELLALDAGLAARRAELKATLRVSREDRRSRRRALDPSDVAGQRALDDESRAEDLARRAAERGWAERRAPLAGQVARYARTVAALERLRRLVSREAMRQIHAHSTVTSFGGASTTLRALFSPREPPWAAGDCAAPKLLELARRRGLVPVALAELWWGPPPPGGGRVHGAYFPACTPKCGPLLPFMLDGRLAAPAIRVPPTAHALEVVYADDRVVVVDKPPGLLSVPSRDERVADSALARLGAMFPSAAGPLLVHRLDLETSGLLLAALDQDAHRVLQAQFLSRSVAKRYEALVDGAPASREGTIQLPLRVDLEARPRQVVDFVHGKPAVTRFAVLGREGPASRVSFWPRTGRTHQLRVHAAHRDGLGTPITGDALYGAPGPRLCLHAAELGFTHPDGRRVTLRSAVPF